MNTSLAKKPASFMREHTQQVRDHIATMARLTDQYLAALKRAEAQYFEGVRRITEAVTEATQPTEPIESIQTTEQVINPSPTATSA